MLDLLVDALVQSKNQAADDLLLEALDVGTEREKNIVIEALFKRQSTRGLSGVIGRFDSLAEPLQLNILSELKVLHHAIRECGRSDEPQRRLAAMKLIAIGRQGKLAYVLSENLHATDETLSKAAVDAIVALSRWIATETRNLARLPDEERAAVYHDLMEQRPEIEQAVARAMDVHRGKHGAELLRAAMLLCDWPGSKTLAILHTAKHGGQSPMVRRLQQPPASEHVEAFLLGASHGQLRSHFGIAFSHIDEAPVLDALLRRTHWVKDHQLQLCLHQVTRGAWWGDAELVRDIERRSAADAARIADWLAVSGVHDIVQDERMERLRDHAKDDFASRLRLFRLAAARPRGASLQLIRSFLSDPDERLVRLASREIVGRRPPEFENMLLQLMVNAPDSVRRVISRSIGQVGFEQFWHRFDRLDKSTRRSAGKAMLKMLPDGIQRLSRRLATGPLEQRLKAMQIVQELQIVDALKASLLALCSDPQPRLRSKAIALLGSVDTVPPDVILDKVLHDQDARVRSNAIEALESKPAQEYVPMLVSRTRSGNSRERANAIKALHRMRVKSASDSLTAMLRDTRAEHRISALWALRHIGFWQLINEVGRLAKQDDNVRVRRYALGVLKNVAETVRARDAAKATAAGTATRGAATSTGAATKTAPAVPAVPTAAKPGVAGAVGKTASPTTPTSPVKKAG